MTIFIEYQSEAFPCEYGLGTGLLRTSWDDLLWAAITIGRPRTYDFLSEHGRISLFEALFRLSLIKMAVEQSSNGRLVRTSAFAALDPTEKGMVSYFLGMTLCKLFATRLLNTPWVLHLDALRPTPGFGHLGRSRPDLVGEDRRGRWHAFESKGRSSTPSLRDIENAKVQATRIVKINGKCCALHIGTFAYFATEELKFYWRDPEPNTEEPLSLIVTNAAWQYYYEAALRLSFATDEGVLTSARGSADIAVDIHPKIRQLLIADQWAEARATAENLRESLLNDGYRSDGLRVKAGRSWPRRSMERAL